MSTWTKADEMALKKLEAKKDNVEKAQKGALSEVVEVFHYRDISSDDLVENMIKNVDTLLPVLAPYSKQYEVHKTRKKG